MHTIECGVEGSSRWSGIVAVGTKLFCAPCNASSVLAIDADCSSKEAQLSEKLRLLAQGGAIPDTGHFYEPGPRLKSAFG